jgi:hypothetical protein
MLVCMRWLAFVLLSVCLSAADPREELLEAGRAFARDTAARGLDWRAGHGKAPQPDTGDGAFGSLGFRLAV